jgi:uncharacterized protein with ATP-grasp and redox domains
MKSVPECMPCSLRQILNTSRSAGADVGARREMVIRASELAREMDFTQSPAHNSTMALKIVPAATGCPDPYEKEKSEFNRSALALLPELRARVEASPDRMLAAALTAVAGNVIDLGIAGGAEIDVAGSLNTVFREGFAINHLDRLKRALTKPCRIMYLADNAGEIVFDIPLLAELSRAGHDVIFAVHGGPVLNDALMEDARETGIDRMFRVMSTGSDWVGLEWGTCDEGFRQAFRAAAVVIAKGQGNYETVEGLDLAPADTYFILKAKCRPVAKSLGIGFGQVALKRKGAD